MTTMKKGAEARVDERSGSENEPKGLFATVPCLTGRIERVFDACSTPAQGREFVLHAFSGPPSRRVRAGGTRSVTRFVSRAMGCVVQAESRGPEELLLRILDADPDAAR